MPAQIDTTISLDDAACEILNELSSFDLAPALARRLNRSPAEIRRALNGVFCATARIIRDRAGSEKVSRTASGAARFRPAHRRRSWLAIAR